MAVATQPPWLKALHARSLALNGSLIKPPAPKAAPVPQGAAFGGTNGPYIGTLPAPSPGGGGGGDGVAPPQTQGPASIMAGAYSPDYAALIKGDPGLLSTEADITDYQNRLGTARQDAIRRAIIGGGFTDGGIGVGGDIDQATLDAAKANQFSTAAQLAEQKLHGNTDLEANLAARGILSSGAETGGLQRIQHNYEQGSTNAIQQLLGLISGYQNDYTDKVYTLQQQRQAARQAAADRIQNDPRYQGTAGSAATLDPASGLYQTADGRWYDANGNPVAAPSGPGSPAAAAPQTPAAVSQAEWDARAAARNAGAPWTAGF